MSAVLLVVQAACREASVPPKLPQPMGVAAEQPMGVAAEQPMPVVFEEPVVIAAEQPGPSAIALDADFVYWNHAGRGLIRKVPRRGGPVVTLFDDGGKLGGHSIAVTADSVYFDRGFEVMRVPKAGGPATHVADLPSLPAVLVADDDAVYVAAAGGVVRYARDGGEGLLLASDAFIWDVAVDATHAYWVSDSGLWRVAKRGGAAEILARGRFRFSRLALDDNDIYWGDGGLEAVLAVAKRGGKPRFVAHGWRTGSHRLAVRQRTLWVLQVTGELDRIDPQTGTSVMMPVVLARGGVADHFYGLAVTATDVFVAAGGSTLTGAAPAVIDLTQPGAALPAVEYDGEVLRVPATPPRAPIQIDAALPEVGRVWFTGMAMQDPSNATRWMNRLDEEIVSSVRNGKLGLRLVAFASEEISEAAAAERGKLVEDTIRAQLGGSPRIAIVTARSPADHGGVHVTLDPGDLSTALTPVR